MLLLDTESIKERLGREKEGNRRTNPDKQQGAGRSLKRRRTQCISG